MVLCFFRKPLLFPSPQKTWDDSDDQDKKRPKEITVNLLKDGVKFKTATAQQARGADFETGNILNRAKNLIPVLVPLFISAFRIAQDMAMAMEARCYRGGEGRTRMNQMKMGRIDIITGVLFILYMTIIIMMRVIL